MKKTVLFIAGVVCAFVLGFSIHAKVRAQTTGDDLAQALANHGMDPTMAPAAATVIEITLSNGNKEVSRIAALEALNLDARLKVLEAKVNPPPPPAPAAAQSVAADQCLAASTCPGASTGDPVSSGAVDGKKIFLTTGQTYDYKLTLPAAGPAGTYVISARLCNSTNSTGVTTVHFEVPAGIPLGGPLTLPALQQWTTLSSSPVALKAAADGTVTLHLVVDASATPVGAGGLMDAVAVTPQ